jgi:hypothetical protein
VFGDKTFLKSEDVEEDVLTEYQPLALGEDVGSVLKRSHHLETMAFFRHLTDVLPQSVNAVGGARIVLYVFLRVDWIARSGAPEPMP